ncbi:MAG: hypothetical protein U0936_12840 [Planctomycetaceae bacterium]
MARYLELVKGWFAVLISRTCRRHSANLTVVRLEVIAIDEIYVGKKNKFFTIVIPIMTGGHRFCGRRKGPDALKPF